MSQVRNLLFFDLRIVVNIKQNLDSNGVSLRQLFKRNIINNKHVKI